MASGKEHDKSTKLWSLLFTVALSLVLGPKIGLLFGTTFLIGGLWLSPDLDTKSNALKRWGFLQWIWKPYQKLIPHRSILSHGPFIGTTIRISYLVSLISIIIYVCQQLELVDLELFTFIKEYIYKNLKYTIICFLSLEASAWLHLIKDGDPLPKIWTNRKSK